LSSRKGKHYTEDQCELGQLVAKTGIVRLLVQTRTEFGVNDPRRANDMEAQIVTRHGVVDATQQRVCR